MRRGSLLFGLALISVGAVFLGESLGWVGDGGEVIADWWPSIIVAAGLLELVAEPRNVANGVVLSVIGLALLLLTTDVIGSAQLTMLWPLGLIALGLWVVAGRPRPRRASAGPDLDLLALFGGQEARVGDQVFTGGSAVAVFGACEIDLTEAELRQDTTLEAFAVFGGVEIRVPEGWQVRVSGPAIFGGFENATASPTDPDAPVLTVRGAALFGGVEIKDRAPKHARRGFRPTTSAP